MAFHEIGWQKGEITPSWAGWGAFNVLQADGGEFKLFASGRVDSAVVMWVAEKRRPYETVQINQPTRCNNFSSLLLDVYIRLNMFRASSRLSSGAQLLPTTTNSTATTTLQR
jgi:hypothetical protein